MVERRSTAAVRHPHAAGACAVPQRSNGRAERTPTLSSEFRWPSRVVSPSTPLSPIPRAVRLYRTSSREQIALRERTSIFQIFIILQIIGARARTAARDSAHAQDRIQYMAARGDRRVPPEARALSRTAYPSLIKSTRSPCGAGHALCPRPRYQPITAVDLEHAPCSTTNNDKGSWSRPGTLAWGRSSS